MIRERERGRGSDERRREWIDGEWDHVSIDLLTSNHHHSLEGRA